MRPALRWDIEGGDVLDIVHLEFSAEGVTLVGAFPDASIMLRTLYRPPHANGDLMVFHPERINPRADIVLADLDGHWENPYQLRTAPASSAHSG